jgi:putative ABC transport system permease protein
MNDLRFGLRQFIRKPGVTAVAVATLALGIGATTAIFSVVDHLMLRPLPFDHAERLVTVWQNNHSDGLPRDDVSPANFLDWRERNAAFDGMAAAEPYSMDLTGLGTPEVLFGVLATEGFFDVLGVRPALGRLFRPEDWGEGAGQVAVLSHRLWQRRFGGDSSLVGRALMIDGEPRVVVGILPAGFELAMLTTVDERGLWVPRLSQGWEQTSRSSAWWNVVARLKPGVSYAQAQADMDRVARALAVEFPATNSEVGATVVPIREHLVGSARSALFVLLGATVLVLLIGCANVAHLLLARATEREGEFAVRAALGARRTRLVRQLLSESLTLAAAGAGLGFVVAFWSVDLIKALAPGNIARLDSVHVDLRILAFAMITGVGTALVFGLAPALQGSRPDLHHTLKEARGSQSGRRLRAGLVVGETAIALTLLIGAGLLLRSFVTLLAVDPGFQTDRLLALQIFAWEDEQTNTQRVQFFDLTLERMRALPGVTAVGAVSAAPFLEANLDIRRAFSVDGQPSRVGEERQTYLSIATTDYFRAMGIPLLAGRDFTDADRLETPSVAVINESLRRRHWPDREPVGDRIRIGTGEQVVEIVGVVGDVRHTGLESDPRPELFLPHGQTGYGSMTYFVRTRGRPDATLDAAKRIVWDLDPRQTFYRTAPVRMLVAKTLAPRRFNLVLLITFAGIALLMAAVGIYGVISFAISRRTHEVGIRMALGADRAGLVALLVREGVRPAAAGVGLGLVGALVVSRVLSSQLYGVPARDVATFAAAGITLLAVAAVASYLPARRAAGVDPTEALRHE